MKYSFFLPPPSTHMYTAAPPAPKDYSILLDQPFPQTNNSATVTFNFTFNLMFNINYAITAYKISPLYSNNKNISLATVADAGFLKGGVLLRYRAQSAREIFKATPIFN